MQEAGGADFYDRIYASERPEIFLKAPRSRTVGPGGEVGIRSDSHWNVSHPTSSRSPPTTWPSSASKASAN